jgi:hypothetical protein
VIVGAPLADPDASKSGAAYVVFGKAKGYPANLNLSSLNGKNGFLLSGDGAFNYLGRSVSSAGDINGDGFDDIIVGAEGADGYRGAVYVLFGRATPFAPKINVASINGTNGFKISGAGGSFDGDISVSDAGDINGDGLTDIIVGAPSAHFTGPASGSAYVVFGHAGTFAPAFSLRS